MSVLLSHFGGIIPRLAEHMLGPNQATMAHDVKLRNGRLEAWREPCEFGSVDPSTVSFHLHGCCLSGWAIPTDVAELAPDWGRYYYTDRKTGGLNYVTVDSCCNQRVAFCGVPAPTAPLTTSSLEQCGRESDARSYVYTFVNEWGEESAPSPASNVVRVDDGTAVNVSGFSSPPDGYGIVAISLYRATTGFRPADGKVQNPLTEYLFVSQFPVGQSVFADDLRSVLLGAALETQYDRTPPSGITGVVSIGDQVRLAAFRRNRIYFSEQFQPHNWPAKYDLTLDFNIVHMLAQDQRLFVTTDSIPYIIDVSSCDDTKCTPVTSLETSLPDIGCHPHGAIMTAHGMFYATPTGIILLQPDGRWHVVTAKWFGETEWQRLKPDTIRMAYWEGYLVFATDMATFMLNINGKPYGDMDGAELCTLSIHPADLLITNTGKLMFLQDGKVWTWDSGATYMPYLWRSRPLMSDAGAYGHNELAAANPANAPVWWPSVLKLGGIAAVKLTDSREHKVLERLLSNTQCRIPRCGRHTWYKLQFESDETVEYASLGTSIFTASQGK